MNKQNKIISTFIIVICTAGLVYSLVGIVRWEIDTRKTNKQISQIQSSISNVEKGNIFTELKKTNSSTVGWIRVADTNVNYPIVQADNNEYYLSHSFNKDDNKAGWIFMDYRNSTNFSDSNTIIYGHDRKDGTMFGSLDKYLKIDWRKDSDGQITISDQWGESSWKIFSSYHIKSTNDYLQTTFTNDDEYLKFIQLIHSRSIYIDNSSVGVKDKILTLSTCYSESEKTVIHARLIKNKYY